MMRMKRWWKVTGWSAAGFVLLFVVTVGPWPTVSGDFTDADYYRQALHGIDQSLSRHRKSAAPGRLRAGWGQAKLQPPPGTPLAGYGGRNGKPSQGVHDDLLAQAVAVSDGEDTAVLVGTDLLVVPPDLAEAVRQGLARETPLQADDILFSASHTHSGPGGLAPGVIAKLFFGSYDPRVPAALSQAVLEAARQAYRDLKPARMALAEARAADLIRNRSRQGPVDDEISVMMLEQEGGRRCVVFSFSAHPTVLGDENMLFSADYPGYARRFLEQKTGAAAVFLGGAVGSMSCRIPAGEAGRKEEKKDPAQDPFERCRAMGEAVGARVLDRLASPAWAGNAEVLSAAAAFDLPPLQWRPLSPSWRASNILTRALGLPSRGWISMVRVGSALFLSIPGDLSGEISADWKRRAAAGGYDLWCSSFSGEYAGYISPDKYYADWADAKGGAAYETAIMSWLGPRQEAFFTALQQHMFRALAE
ncbi:MAG: hypothetical protein FJZ97_14080 [Chloroflexi bacterium]|nr:hypothetical protein [Chloroflexota bacterium]